MITRQTVRDEILAYLNRRLTLDQLVGWAEEAMNEGALDPQDASLLAEVIARIGAADIHDFGMTWDDCHGFLSRLGFKVEVKAA